MMEKIVLFCAFNALSSGQENNRAFIYKRKLNQKKKQASDKLSNITVVLQTLVNR